MILITVAIRIHPPVDVLGSREGTRNWEGQIGELLLKVDRVNTEPHVFLPCPRVWPFLVCVLKQGNSLVPCQSVSIWL